MAIAEREEMRIAHRLKNDGWAFELLEVGVLDCQERANWCRATFGPMHSMLDPTTFSYTDGKWYGVELPFQTGGVTLNRQFVFMFRDDKLYTMYKMMFPK